MKNRKIIRPENTTKPADIQSKNIYRMSEFRHLSRHSLIDNKQLTGMLVYLDPGFGGFMDLSIIIAEYKQQDLRNYFIFSPTVSPGYNRVNASNYFEIHRGSGPV